MAIIEYIRNWSPPCAGNFYFTRIEGLLGSCDMRTFWLSKRKMPKATIWLTCLCKTTESPNACGSLLRRVLVWATTPSSLSLTSSARPPLAVPSTPSYAYVAAFASKYETSLRDTTSAVNTLNLAPCSFYSLCCNQHLVWPDYC